MTTRECPQCGRPGIWPFCPYCQIATISIEEGGTQMDLTELLKEHLNKDLLTKNLNEELIDNVIQDELKTACREFIQKQLASDIGGNRFKRWWVRLCKSPTMNSPLVIFLLSTVLVGLVGWIYTGYEKSSREDKQRTRQREKLSIEIHNRIQVAKSNLLPDPTKFDMNDVQKDLDGKGMAAIFPELKDRSLQSLVYELTFFVDNDKQKKKSSTVSQNNEEGDRQQERA